MISRLEGELVAVHDGRASVRCGHVTCDVLLPAADQGDLAARLNETVSFHTLCYLEGQGQGTSFVPRLIGFQSESDRRFFELFTTVKGMGNRKALRALALPFPTIASAIAAKDVIMLKSLPEIGARTAETIVAELHGKVDQIIELKPLPRSGGPAELAAAGGIIADAVVILRSLGEPAVAARQLVDRALAADPTIDTPDGLVAAAFRLREIR